MIKHIVMFAFKDENKENNIQKVKELLESLTSKIDIIRSLEVGINFDKAPRAMDISLVTTFDSVEDLDSYAKNKEHQKVIEFIKEVTEYTKVVDYII
jgi:hypothetical protein